MEDEGTKAVKRPCEDLVNSASATTGIKAVKRPCEDLVNSASATTGTEAQVTGGSIFMPPSVDSSAYVYDASGSSDRRKKRCSEDLGRSFVENPSSALATTGTKAQVTGGSIFKPPSVDSSAYVYDASEVWYDIVRVGGRRVKEIRYPKPFRKPPLEPHGITRRMPRKSGMMPPLNLPREIVTDDPFYRAAVANGVEVEVRGSSWCTKPMGNLFYPFGF